MSLQNLPLFAHPEISIILPTYNRAAYLNRCIDSVISQSFPDWELIIVDDGSSDPTLEIVDPYLTQFPHIRYMKHRNRQMGLSRNAGIQASFGQYITFIDSDDQYKPEHLESRLTYLKNHPDVDLISGGFESSEEIWFTDFVHPEQKIYMRECALGPTFFGKRHVFFELKGFNDLRFGEDPDFWMRAEQVFHVQKITQPETYIYTRAPDSISREWG